jgi:quercetin dioxygenase-like cupin family protein
MKVMKKKSVFVDVRGEIIDILEGEIIDYVTLITSVKGAVRGSHYHKETFQYIYMLAGKMNLLTQVPEQEVVSTILEKGDFVENPPLERHTMIALEDSVFLVLTRGPRGGDNYEKDTYRLPEPLAPR